MWFLLKLLQYIVSFPILHSLFSLLFLVIHFIWMGPYILLYNRLLQTLALKRQNTQLCTQNFWGLGSWKYFAWMLLDESVSWGSSQEVGQISAPLKACLGVEDLLQNYFIRLLLDGLSSLLAVAYWSQFLGMWVYQ